MDPSYTLAMAQSPPGTLSWILHFDHHPKAYNTYLSTLPKSSRTSSAKQIYPTASLTDAKLRAHLMMAKHKKFLEQDPEGWRKFEESRVRECGFEGEELEKRVRDAVLGRADRMWVRFVMELQGVEERREGKGKGK
ncbi:hypothetical protein AC578_75 [Pseudocercospora eumusae]|uniref:Uncharacterized protein n=1 Tax=Pseudocercospora eumusae TaxID=321146 RepID=A0A139HPA7_9PEZI|nr:hypothetical protein AC578_75 [Pseudocercospora eumusae]